MAKLKQTLGRKARLDGVYTKALRHLQTALIGTILCAATAMGGEPNHRDLRYSKI